MKLKFILPFLFLFFPLASFAGFLSTNYSYSYYAQVEAGVGYGKIGTGNFVQWPLSPFWPAATYDVFTNTSSTKGRFEYAAQLGVDVAVQNRIRLEAGVDIGNHNNYLTKGVGTLGGAIDVFRYQYRVDVGKLTGNARILFLVKPWLRPYFEAGLGAAFVYSSPGTIRTVDPIYANPYRFIQHKRTHFVWQAGLGLNVMVTNNIGVMVGYRYFELMRSRIRISNGVSIDKFKTGNIGITDIYGAIRFMLNPGA